MSGLKDFQSQNSYRPSAPAWFNCKNGESKDVQFLVEPTELTFFVEHVSPHDWKQRAICTGSECFACEQQTFQWNQSIRMYLPVLHNGKPHVIAQGVGVNSLLHSIMQHYLKRGTIKDVLYRVSRKGEGKRSAYSSEPLDSQVAVAYNRNVDLNKLTKTIDYKDQKTYYKEK